MTLVLPVNKGEAVGGEFGFRSHYPSLASAGTPVTLSGESARSTTTQRLLKDECDEPLLPGQPVPPCAPPPPAGALGTRLALDRAHAGRVYLRASTAIADTAGAGTGRERAVRRLISTAGPSPQRPSACRAESTGT